jgi:hypothetical protein
MIDKKGIFYFFVVYMGRNRDSKVDSCDEVELVMEILAENS